MYRTDSKNIGMTGVPEEEYRQFLKDLEELNNQYNDVFRADERRATQSFVDAAEFPGQTPDNFTSGIGPSGPTHDAYVDDFYKLVNQYGINPVVEGSDKVYYLDPGMPGVNPYGPDARFNDPSGTRPGMYTRDERTTGDFQWGDALKNLGVSLATGGISNVIGGADSLGGLLPVPGIMHAFGAYRAGSDSNYGVNTPGIMDFADSRGNPTSNVDLKPVPGEGLLDWIGDNIGGTDGLRIPIPGLPFPLPGNMSINDLWEIAKNTGRTIQQVIQDMTSGKGEDAFESDEEDDSGIFIPGDDDSQRRPTVVPGEDRDRTPPVSPVDIPPVNENPNENIRPGIEGSDTRNRPGFEAALLGLLPFMAPDPKPQAPGEFNLWDYIGPDKSYGIERPDYGTPEMAALYDFPGQPNQPVGVDYNPQQRNDFINPVEAERRRRGLL